MEETKGTQRSFRMLQHIDKWILLELMYASTSK